MTEKELHKVERFYKNVLCPNCGSKIQTRYATDGTWILQDSKPKLKIAKDESGLKELIKSILQEIEKEKSVNG